MPAPSILLVDDDTNAPVLLRHALAKAGFTGPLRTMSSADELTRLLAKPAEATRLPDMLFLDLLLADGHGFDLLKLIRADPRGSEMFVVALSGSSHPADIDGAFSLGADAYLEKYPSELTLRALRTAFESKERGKRLCFLHT